MTTLFYSVMIVVPAAVLLASVVYTMKKHSEGQSIKKSLRMNAATFAVMVLLVAGCAMGAFATGSEDTTAAPADTTAAQASDAVAESAEATTVKDNSKGLGLLAAGLVTGLAGIGGGMAVASAAVSQWPPALPQLSPQRARIPRHSVKRLSSSPSVSR